MTELNKSLPANIPDRVRRLPVDSRGFPVPWFVAILDGVPDFRVIGPGKMVDAVQHKRCWICGEKLGRALAFVIGPMCAINRVTSEPPSHLDCADFAARACPFLTKPNMRRNEKDLPPDRLAPRGIHIEDNPGAACVWVTRTFKPFDAGNGVLFNLGEPLGVRWYTLGRPATRPEVDAAIAARMPLLLASAEKDGPESVAELQRMVERARHVLPI